MRTERQILIGLQNSGKSTFLAALFHAVESGQIRDALQLANLGEDRTYLVELRNRWLNCQELDRTKLGDEQVLTLTLQNDEGHVIELVLPDVSGETFRDQWEQRKTTKVFDDLAQQATGALLFIHPDTVKSPVRINMNREVASVITDGELRNPPEAQPDPIGLAETEWSPKFSPTQVKIVEILQFLTREPHIYPLRNLAVVVSAWDLLKDDYATPSEWLERELPFLAQFLKSHSDRIPNKVFGVSAQGGSLDQAIILQGFDRQAERIQLVTDTAGEFSKNDITAPIKWLMQTV